MSAIQKIVIKGIVEDEPLTEKEIEEIYEILADCGINDLEVDVQDIQGGNA